MPTGLFSAVSDNKGSRKEKARPINSDYKETEECPVTINVIFTSLTVMKSSGTEKVW